MVKHDRLLAVDEPWKYIKVVNTIFCRIKSGLGLIYPCNKMNICLKVGILIDAEKHDDIYIKLE